MSRQTVLIFDEAYRRPEGDGGSRALHDLHRTLVELGHDATLSSAPASLRAQHWDTVFMSRPMQAMRWAPLAQASGRRRIFVGHDLHHLRIAGELRAQGKAAGPDQAMAAVERACWRLYGLSLYPAASECAVVSAAGGRGRWFPYYRIDAVRPPRQRQPRDPRPLLLFVGGAAHKPNVLGMGWFADHVLPLLGDVRTVVAGTWPQETRLSLEAKGIEFAGFCSDEDLDALRAEATALIAPLTCGAGLKCKVIEAMASGVPLITSSIGLQGIEASHEVALRADAPGAWVAALRSIAEDDGLVAGRCAAAAAYVEMRHGPAAYIARLRDILHEAEELERTGDCMGVAHHGANP